MHGKWVRGQSEPREGCPPELGSSASHCKSKPSEYEVPVPDSLNATPTGSQGDFYRIGGACVAIKD